MIEPKWSSEDQECAIISEALSIGDYMVGSMDERRRVLDILADKQYRDYTRRELAELIARGR